MANKNICDVDLLQSMSKNTNVIVDENGKVNKLNLYNEFDNVNKSIDDVNENVAQLSNPNLLINSDFRNPINQRGASSYSGLGNYTIDRWRLLTNTAILTVNQDSITLNGSFSQYIEMPLIEGDYTMSISINGVVYHSTINNFKGSWVAKEIGENSNTWALAYTNNCLRLEYYPQIEVNIEYIKLEQGSIATPFVPRPYGEELELCKRFYQRLSGIREVRNAYASNKLFFKTWLVTPIRYGSGTVKECTGVMALYTTAWATIKNVNFSEVTFNTGEDYLEFIIPHTANGEIVLNVTGEIVLDAEIY